MIDGVQSTNFKLCLSLNFELRGAVTIKYAQLENESRVYHKNITPAIISKRKSSRGCFKSVSINCPLAPFRAKNHQHHLSNADAEKLSKFDGLPLNFLR